MTRIIKHEAKEPLKITIGDKTIWICMCGLSKKLPYCDGAHKKTRDEEEGKLYKYVEGNRIEMKDF